MEDLHRILEAIQDNGQRSVLATITHVEGSAYRKEGALMLFFEDGSQIGVLSAGCLETDLAARVPEILAAGVSCGFVFDVQSLEHLSWGEETGCGGVIHVTMEPVNGVLLEHLRTLKDCLDQHTEVKIIKKISPDRSVSDYAFVSGKERFFGEWRGGFPQDLMELAVSEGYFIHTYYPKPRLTIFGAGPDARPLAAFAAAAGFSVTVSDWRPAWCNRSYFPDVDTLLVGFPEETVDMIQSTSNDYVVVMTHNFRRDQQLLRLLSERQLCYLGFLGPRHRMERLLNGNPAPENLRSPVGIAIGAEGPVEIAVSILAELIDTYHKNRRRTTVSYAT
ncbi:XdhC family protein [Paenibacillus motobuensis]|uniref:XdhC family protein n=1 Tax=Paenibacillus motobuensis TaxID=295324 RepID=A0ABN0YGZ2_9BACL